MNPQVYYSRIISIGRRASPTFDEARRDLARVQSLMVLAQGRLL